MAAPPFDGPSRGARDKPPRAGSMPLAGRRRRHRSLSPAEARVGFRVRAATVRKSLRYARRHAHGPKNSKTARMHPGKDAGTRDRHVCAIPAAKPPRDRQFQKACSIGNGTYQKSAIGYRPGGGIGFQAMEIASWPKPPRSISHPTVRRRSCPSNGASPATASSSAGAVFRSIPAHRS